MTWRDEPLTKGDMYDALAASIQEVENFKEGFKHKLPNHMPGVKKLRAIVNDGFDAALAALRVASRSISGEDA